MNDLRTLLDLATDAIEPPRLTAHAIEVAEHRRARRRVVLASAVAVLLVGGVTVGIDAVSARDGAGPVTPVAPVAPTAPIATGQGAPAIDPGVVQTPWDPADVAALPEGAATLPRTLAVPVGAASLEESPLAVAVAAVETVDGIGLVDPAGSWRATPCPETAADRVSVPVVLSPDGTRLAFMGRTRLWWRDLDGPWRAVAYPAEMAFRPDFAGRGLSMPTRDQVDVGYDPGGRDVAWAVDLATGRATRLPFQLTEKVAQQGDVTLRMGLEDDNRRLLRTWRGVDEVGPPLDISVLDDLANPVLGEGGVVAGRVVESYTEPRADRDLDGLLAFDPDDGVARAYLPFGGDPDSGFGWAFGGVRPVGWVDADRVLLSVVPESDAIVVLVTWDVETGALARVSSYAASAYLAVATDLLGGDR